MFQYNLLLLDKDLLNKYNKYIITAGHIFYNFYRRQQINPNPTLYNITLTPNGIEYVFDKRPRWTTFRGDKIWCDRQSVEIP